MSKKVYSARFKAIVTWVFEQEGKFFNPSQNQGRVTNVGITSAVLSHARGRIATIKDVQSLSQEETIALYHTYYWLPIQGDDLPSGIDHVIFDMAIHSGVSCALTLLQEALNVDSDGVIGPKTLAALNNRDLKVLVKDIFVRRREFLKGLPSFITLGLEWENRLTCLEEAALTVIEDSRRLNNMNEVHHIITPTTDRTLLMNSIGLLSLITGFFGYTFDSELITLLMKEVAQVIASFALIGSIIFQIRLKRNTHHLTILPH